MRKDEFFELAARQVLAGTSAVDDALSCMIILHTMCLHVRQEIQLEDSGSESFLSPLTRRHAAEIIAAAMNGKGSRFGDAPFWYYEYDCRTPFETIDDVTDHWKAKVNESIGAFRVTDVVDDLHEA